MEITQESYSIETSEDFKTTKFGIDEGSMSLMMKMLYSNLYSDPIGSIVREVTSNCVDAHTEVGQTRPYEVELVEENRFTGIFEPRIIFRDFGPGLSPDRMEKVYTQYFASTKRSDNTQIGGFGLGAKSPLAYSDSFFINTVVDGTLYNYTVQRTGDGESELILLDSSDTDRVNGSEVEIPVKVCDRQSFKNAIYSQLPYFKNLVVKGLHSYESGVITEYTNFIHNTHSNKHELHIILGNVSYPLNRTLLGIEGKDCNLALKFDIGELSVSINREAIYYDEKTKAAILARYELAMLEAVQIVSDSLKNETDIYAFLQKVNSIRASSNRYSSSYDGEDPLVNINRLANQALGEMLFDGMSVLNIEVKLSSIISLVKVGWNSSKDKVDDYWGVMKSEKPAYLLTGNQNTHKTYYIYHHLHNRTTFIIGKLETIEKLIENTGLIDQVHINEFERIIKHVETSLAGKSYDDVVIDPDIDTFHLIKAKLKAEERPVETIPVKELVLHATGYQKDLEFRLSEYNTLRDINKTIIYAYQEDEEKLKAVMSILLQSESSRDNSSDVRVTGISIFKVSKSYKKHFKTSNCMNVDDFIASDHPILRDVYTTIQITPRLEAIKYMKGFDTINLDIYSRYKALSIFAERNTSKRYNLRQSLDCPVVGGLLGEVLEARKLVNQARLDELEVLMEYSKGIEILNYVNFRTDKYSSVSPELATAIEHVLETNDKVYDRKNNLILVDLAVAKGSDKLMEELDELIEVVDGKAKLTDTFYIFSKGSDLDTVLEFINSLKQDESNGADELIVHLREGQVDNSDQQGSDNAS